MSDLVHRVHSFRGQVCQDPSVRTMINCAGVLRASIRHRSIRNFGDQIVCKEFRTAG